MTFRRAIFDFIRARRGEEDATFSNDHISITPRKTFHERQQESIVVEST
jgi:hypothetical protein